MDSISKFFDLEKLGTNPKREFIAGLTTFFAMCYILFVNPSVLGASGMDKGAVFTATAWLYSSAQDRLSTGPVAKAAPILTALGLYLAAQCLM